MPKISISVTLEEVKQAVADYIRVQTGHAVNPADVAFTYSRGYNDQEVNGAKAELPAVPTKS